MYRFKIAFFFAAATALLAWSNGAKAQRFTDRVRTTKGSESGEVTAMTPLEVTIGSGADKRSVPVNEIKSIIFDGEPTELTQARVNIANGGFVDAAEKLAKIDAASLDRDLLKQEFQFLKAFAAAKLALSGNGEIVDAGRELNAFVRANPQSFHFFEATQAMGDLLLAAGQYDSAQKQYAELASTPWPEYKLRAAVAIGSTLQAQGKHKEAITQFDTVLSASGNTPETQEQVLAATLGKAISTAEIGDLIVAVGMIEKIIHDADPEAKELHARAYNALGNCYERAGRSKEALLAYLHVDVLYSAVPEAHAEALSRLVPLWKTVGQESRSREARQMLEDRYGGSRWAKSE